MMACYVAQASLAFRDGGILPLQPPKYLGSKYVPKWPAKYMANLIYLAEYFNDIAKVSNISTAKKLNKL